MDVVTQSDSELIHAALAREAGASRQLVLRFAPIIRHRVARALVRHHVRMGHAARREDIDDLQHDVFVTLYDRGAHVLRTWDPARGLSLDNFIGLVAQREADAILRSGRRSAWAEVSTVDDVMPVTIDKHCPERTLAAREALHMTWQTLHRRLSPRSLLLFQALFMHDQSVPQVCAQYDMTANAVYLFRTRLQTVIDEIQQQLGPRTRVDESAQPRASAALRELSC